MAEGLKALVDANEGGVFGANAFEVRQLEVEEKSGPESAVRVPLEIPLIPALAATSMRLRDAVTNAQIGAGAPTPFPFAPIPPLLSPAPNLSIKKVVEKAERA